MAGGGVAGLLVGWLAGLAGWLVALLAGWLDVRCSVFDVRVFLLECYVRTGRCFVMFVLDL